MDGGLFILVVIPRPLVATGVKDKPQISPVPFKNVLVFNSEYLRQYIYQKTDFVKDAFEVLITTEEYNKLKSDLDKLK